MKEKQTTESLLYKIIQYIYCFFISNIYFLISNIVLLIVLFSVPISLSNVLIYGMALFPTGPSITALFYTMGKLNNEKTIQPTKDYWRAYKRNAKASLIYWGIILIVQVILVVNILFFLDIGWTLVAILTFVIYIFVILTIIHAFSILARFEVKTKNLIVFSFLLVKKYFLKTSANLSLFIAFSVIFYGFPNYALLCIFSVASYYFMRNNEPILKDMEDQYLISD